MTQNHGKRPVISLAEAIALGLFVGLIGFVVWFTLEDRSRALSADASLESAVMTAAVASSETGPRAVLAVGSPGAVARAAECEQFGSMLTTFAPPGAVEVRVFGMNNAGDIAGAWRDGSGTERGYLRHAAADISVIDVDDASGTRIVDINDGGEAVGTYTVGSDPEPLRRGLWLGTDGTLLRTELAGADTTIFHAINAGGTAVGQSTTGEITRGITRSRDASYRRFWVEPLRRTVGLAINSFGHEAGSYADGDDMRGFVRRSDGDIETFSIRESPATWVYGLNDAGDVVGLYQGGDQAAAFYRYADGTVVTLDDQGWRSSELLDVNNFGEAIGRYEDVDGVMRAFIRSADATITVLDATHAEAINDYGDVAGTTNDDDGRTVGFIQRRCDR